MITRKYLTRPAAFVLLHALAADAPIITPPFSICAWPTFTAHVPVAPDDLRSCAASSGSYFCTIGRADIGRVCSSEASLCVAPRTVCDALYDDCGKLAF